MSKTELAPDDPRKRGRKQHRQIAVRDMARRLLENPEQPMRDLTAEIADTYNVSSRTAQRWYNEAVELLDQPDRDPPPDIEAERRKALEYYTKMREPYDELAEETPLRKNRTLRQALDAKRLKIMSQVVRLLHLERIPPDMNMSDPEAQRRVAAAFQQYAYHFDSAHLRAIGEAVRDALALREDGAHHAQEAPASPLERDNAMDAADVREADQLLD